MARSRVMYHTADTAARRSIERHGLDWRRLGVGGAYRPLGNYLWDSLDFALWYAQAYDDYDIWAADVEGLQLLPDPGFGEFADGVEHAWCSPQRLAAERLVGIEACSGGDTPEQLTPEGHDAVTSFPGWAGAWAKTAKRGSGVTSTRPWRAGASASTPPPGAAHG